MHTSATHSRTQHAFDSIHTTHLLFSSAYTSAVHVSSSSDTAVGVCVCAVGKMSRPYSHASDIARVIACAERLGAAQRRQRSIALLVDLH